jgi:asparagine synthase (glutamine-hydrolysing)
MSVQFGRWNFDGRPPSADYIEKAVSGLAPYGPDGQTSYSKDGLTIIYRAFHTTKESRQETQPFESVSGIVITWDGRLDNRTELRQQLGHTLENDCPDVWIVAAAYEHWGTRCFARLIGDWALSIWNPHEQSLILAKDPIGTHHLYYAQDHAQATWSSLLDPLVRFADQSFHLSEEYIAGWLSFFPAPALTPYVGVNSVPPSSFVSLSRGTQRVIKYWDFDAYRKIRYRADEEYEDHFRTVFGEAVRRRLRSETPVLAELSGGMDSSSIVCMADTIFDSGQAETPRIDTVSYFDDSEPNWDERPFFSKVEEKRGRIGCHIDVSSREYAHIDLDGAEFPIGPGSDGNELSDATKQLADNMSAQGIRVVLSGIGGDEITGGVHTAIPELQDLAITFQFVKLVHRLTVWALQKRTPWFHLLRECLREFLPPSVLGAPTHVHQTSWLSPEFVKRNQDALYGYRRRTRLLGPLPSTQEDLTTLDGLRRQLAFDALSCEPLSEKRYPFLDRDFLEFIYAIPREQLVRPGQRRSLMRRAMRDIVPEEIIQRKRKAFVIRRPLVSISRQWPLLTALSQNMVSDSMGIFNADRFRETLTKAKQGIGVPTVTVLRTLEIECWLRRWQQWRQSQNIRPEENQIRSTPAAAVTAAIVPKEQALRFQPKQG